MDEWTDSDGRVDVAAIMAGIREGIRGRRDLGLYTDEEVEELSALRLQAFADDGSVHGLYMERASFNVTEASGLPGDLAGPEGIRLQAGPNPASGTWSARTSRPTVSAANQATRRPRLDRRLRTGAQRAIRQLHWPSGRGPASQVPPKD